MPADTMNFMILGYAVIMGVLFVYVLSLILRTRRTITKEKRERD